MSSLADRGSSPADLHRPRRSFARSLSANMKFVALGLSAGVLIPNLYSRFRPNRRAQAPLVSFAPEDPSSAGDLGEVLRHRGARFAEGRHTWYVPPQEGLAVILGPGVEAYPATAGFKFLRDSRPPEDANYLFEKEVARNWLTGRSRDLAVSANYLHALGIGPRLWDVRCWHVQGKAYTVFVVEHVNGAVPGEEEGRQFVQRLERLCDSTRLRVLLPRWKSSGDFVGPTFNNNLLVRGDGSLCYVDFQNFAVANAPAWPQDVLKDARDTFHFGNTRVGRRSRYLYQQIPGVAGTGKRDTASRWRAITECLAQQNVSVRDRVLLDVGCNSGMMLHSGLLDGASWGVGWDRPQVVQHSRQLLLSLGDTRFTFNGQDLKAEPPSVAGVPAFLHPALPEAIVLFLAMREHIGIPRLLHEFPWRALVYEGHQGESVEGVKTLLASLLTPGVRVAMVTSYSDGDCGERPLALLYRANG